MKGLEVWKNPKNRFVVTRVHYTADPEKALDEWKWMTKLGMPAAAWNKEYEIDFGALSGERIWPMFDPAIHVIPYFEIPRDWIRIRAIDYGSFNPTCCLWGAVDFDGVIYVYREYYRGGRITAHEHAKRIAELSKYEKEEGTLKDDELYADSVIDPSTRAKTQKREGEDTPYSVYDIFNECGVDCTPANSDTHAGWDQIASYLEPQPFYREGKLIELKPKLYIFDRCVNVIKEIPGYRYQELSLIQLKIKDPKEEAVKKRDHGADSLRYLGMTRPPLPERKEAELSFIQKDIRRFIGGDKSGAAEAWKEFNQS